MYKKNVINLFALFAFIAKLLKHFPNINKKIFDYSKKRKITEASNASI